METQTLNKHDFKRYLLQNLADSRQEDLIFWKKGIPLPIDLVYKIFDIRGDLIKLYLDHLSTACLFHISIKNYNSTLNIDFSNLPSYQFKNFENHFSEHYHQFYQKSKISGLTQRFAERLYLLDYSFKLENYLISIFHEGRKYKRLYIPKILKEGLNAFDQDITNLIGISNGDMFGNVIADKLGVYRSGFSDAFAAIFNKLLDFILDRTYDKKISLSTASRIKISQLNELNYNYQKINTGRTSDGSLWEPQYKEAQSTFIINNSHPYYELLSRKSGIEVLVDIACQSSLIESETIKSSTSKVLESFRLDVSRNLRLLAEMDHSD